MSSVTKTRVHCSFMGIALLLNGAGAIAEAGPPPAAAAAQNEIPVYARFIRTSSTGGAGATGIGGDRR